MTRRRPEQAVQVYTRSWGYLRASVKEAQRVDLHGNTAGAVTAAEAAWARLRLEGLEATIAVWKVQRRAQSQQKPQPPPDEQQKAAVVPAKPQRLGLADLKTAWLARQWKLAAAE
jgi:sRNA-binding protein